MEGAGAEAFGFGLLLLCLKRGFKLLDAGCQPGALGLGVFPQLLELSAFRELLLLVGAELLITLAELAFQLAKALVELAVGLAFVEVVRLDKL